MKKKSPRGIPDFARQAPRPKGTSASDATRAPNAKPTAPPPRAKPPSTSGKSGQRGQ